MATPPTLDEWKSAIINPNSDFCTMFKNLLQMPMLLFTWFSYAFESDGKTPTAAFLKDLTGAGVIPSDSVPGQVVGLTASTGLAGYIFVSWQSMPGSTTYYIYRNTSDDITTATLLGSVNGTAYVDTTSLVASTTYYYWIKAWNSIGYGNASESASGSCIAGSSTTQLFTASGTTVVPVAMNRMTVKVWAGGGGGGYGTKTTDWYPLGTTGYDAWRLSTLGGGGGGGGYASFANYTVVAGQTVTIVVGSGGSPGAQGTNSSVTYGGIKVAEGYGGNSGQNITGGTGGSGTGEAGVTVVAGTTGVSGTFSNGGNGGTAYSSGLPAGTTFGTGGIGGGSASSDGIALPTYGINGYVILEFTAV